MNCLLIATFTSSMVISSILFLPLLLVLLLLLTSTPSSLVEASCFEAQMCCQGQNNSCKVFGESLNIAATSKKCHCDTNCHHMGDCCRDYYEVCLEQLAVISTNPSSVNPDLPNKMTVTCKPRPRNHLALERIVTLRLDDHRTNQFAALSEGTGLVHSPGAKASGNIDSARPDESYVSLTKADVKEGGLASCIVVYLTTHGNITVMKRTGKILITHPDYVDDSLIIGAFEEIMSEIRSLTTEQKESFEKDRSEIDEQTAMIKEFREELYDTSVGLQGALDDQQRLLDVATQQEESLEMFTADMSSLDAFPTDGSTLKYTDVTARVGAGYNDFTGTFTAPIAGYYLFKFSVFITAKAYVYVNMASYMAGMSETLATMLGTNEDGWERYADCACVVRLSRMQGVYLAVDKAKGDEEFRDSKYPNRFQGFLLKPDMVEIMDS